MYTEIKDIEKLYQNITTAIISKYKWFCILAGKLIRLFLTSFPYISDFLYLKLTVIVKKSVNSYFINNNKRKSRLHQASLY